VSKSEEPADDRVSHRFADLSSRSKLAGLAGIGRGY